MDLFLSGLLWFLFGLVGGLVLAIVVGAFAFTLGSVVAVQLLRQDDERRLERSTARSSSPKKLHAVAAPEDEQLAAALRHWQFSRPEIDAAVAATREFAGPFDERVRKALATLRRTA